MVKDTFSGPFDSRSLASSFALAQGDKGLRFFIYPLILVSGKDEAEG